MNEPGASGPRRLAVVGGGWSGLATAVHAVRRGHRVTLFETGHLWGGRARSLPDIGLDNGQHILIGAYRATLDLMRIVGADPQRLLLRLPLALRRADGAGLELGRGPTALAFIAAVMRCRAWTWTERAALLQACLGWAAAGFRCEPDRAVADWAAALPAAVRQLLIEPLCVSALNTPAAQASAAVFLNVLRDGMFGPRGSSDLLLPRCPLNDLLPRPALRWLAEHGSTLRAGTRVRRLQRDADGWTVDGEPFDAVVLACPATEAARLAAPWGPQWAQAAAGLRFEPIVTVYVEGVRTGLPAPMTALVEGPRAPAQFVFDHGTIRGQSGRLAFVVSGAARWLDQGRLAIASAVREQACEQLPGIGLESARDVAVVAERRATFLCLPGLERPGPWIAPALAAAGDYVEGPYPATLEGAVRSASAALDAISL